MTQLRKFRDDVSNYFDEVERGIGKRGSTFTDVDAITHDKDTGRFLFREFKREGEELVPAQRWVLAALAHLPGCLVWFVRQRADGRIGWAQFGSGRPEAVITVDEYRAKLARWWSSAPGMTPAEVEEFCEQAVKADEINWSLGGAARRPDPLRKPA